MPVLRPDTIEGKAVSYRGMDGGDLSGGGVDEEALEAIEVGGVAEEAVARAGEGEAEEGEEFGDEEGEGGAAEEEIGETQIKERTHEGGEGPGVERWGARH